MYVNEATRRTKQSFMCHDGTRLPMYITMHVGTSFNTTLQVGPNNKKTPKFTIKKFVKLTDHTYSCNSFTNFENEVHAMTENRNLMKLAWKNCENTST